MSQPIHRGPVRQDRLVSAIGYVCLGVTVSCVAAMSWHGLVAFATNVLHLSGYDRYAVPISLDGAAMACAAMALRATIARDSAAGTTTLLWVFVMASAIANWYQASHTTGVAGALFFSGMSLATTLLFDVVLKQIRRSALQTADAMEPPLPRFRALRWIRFFRETWAAWSLALRFGITRPVDALVLHWEQTGVFDARHAESDPDPQADLLQTLRSASKGEALRIAFRELGCRDVMPALQWLKGRGITPPSRGHAFAIKKELEQEELQSNGCPEAEVVALEAAR